MNRVVLVGRLGRDPKVKTTGNGNSVCTLSLATEERWTDGAGTKQQRTEWHNVVVWGKQAEACGQYLAKGRQVLVEGALRTRKYEHGGVTRFATEIVASHVEFLGDGPRTPQGRAPSTDSSDGDIPF